MKKIIAIIAVVFSITCLTGCGKNKEEMLYENIKKIELSGDLVTYQAYYHNVIEYEKPAESGITHLFEIDRKLFAEYTGTIKFGINLTKVKIDVNGNTINVFIPKAKIIGEPNVDKDDFKAESFITSRDSKLNSNPITVDDSTKAYDKAQNEMKENAKNDEELLLKAQQRAKIVIEENINQFSGLNKNDYTINWEYEQ
jgi:hypothetical protein